MAFGWDGGSLRIAVALSRDKNLGSRRWTQRLLPTPPVGA
jgi:hypothetical protein